MTSVNTRPAHRRRPLSLALTALVLAAGVTGCSAEADSPIASASASVLDGDQPITGAEDLAAPELAGVVDVAQVTQDAPAQTALATAAVLEVKGRAPKTGYSRDEFGARWSDIDHNGCDTRNDILARDLTNVTYKTGTKDCVVLTGTFSDPYSGETVSFTRGETTSSAVQIDHIVALSDAWQKGAQSWDAAKRLDFANDPLNLMAADGPLNAQKGDGDTATWLPPNKAFRCEYVARQVGVKYTYGLWVTEAEQNAMVSVLSGCPTQPLPEGSAIPEAPAPESAPEPTTPEPVAVEPAPEPVAPEPAPTPEPAAPAPAVVPAQPANWSYKNCDEARAAGAAPVMRGTPGYGSHLDRDDDGVGCE